MKSGDENARLPAVLKISKRDSIKAEPASTDMISIYSYKKE